MPAGPGEPFCSPSAITQRRPRLAKGVTREQVGSTTRARDLVDLLLIRQHERVDLRRLRETVRRVFLRRATHAVPERVPPPLASLALAYRREARHVTAVASLEDAHQVLAQWLDPVLAEIQRVD